MKKGIFFKTAAISLASALIFIGVGYFYLSAEKETVQNETESVPYYSQQIEPCGVMFDFLGDRTYFYLDFEAEDLSIIYVGENDIENDEIYGYPIDFTVSADYSLLSYIVDAVGGINLQINEETLSFTGVQIAEIMETTAQRSELIRNITEQIILLISKQGFDREHILYIIENSETDLTVPDCYYWSEYIKEVCILPRIIN